MKLFFIQNYFESDPQDLQHRLKPHDLVEYFDSDMIIGNTVIMDVALSVPYQLSFLANDEVPYILG